MFNSALFIFAAIPAILYNKSLRKLYESCVKLGMSLQELSQALNINPALMTSSGVETEELVEVFEYENEEPEKYIMIFKNGKLNKWYTELKRSIDK
ncbi:hypothetical protein LJC00_01285 [Dysgonomonas sp. OttesenSCG-928-M03]|nr:hypothetical protein [Dysgonomonas sp. OttesenSCG-928-M03]